MARSVCRCVCSSLLVAIVAIPAVLSAPSVAGSSVSAKPNSRPSLDGSVDWSSVRDKTICPAQVAYNSQLRVLEVWCADGVEGLTFAARGGQYVCRSLRYTITVADSQVDVLGGCIARLAETNADIKDSGKLDS